MPEGLPTDSGVRQRLPGPGNGRIWLYCLAAMVLGYAISGRVREALASREEAAVDFTTMNTYGRITVPAGSGARSGAQAAARAAHEAVERVNRLMSPFGTESDVRRLNESPAGQWIEVHPETWHVVMEALRWHRLSGGAFDPTIGAIKALFRFDQGELAAWPDESALDAARRRVGADKLLFDREGMRLSWAEEGMRLDLGAIAKGYAADLAADVLIRDGARSGLVDIGGELRIIGPKPGPEAAPWRVGIRGPAGEGVEERLELVTAAVATSGDYERFFTYRGTRYEHIIDPRTGLPITKGVSSVTVIHPDSCLAADALATTLCVMGPEEGLAFLRDQALSLFSAGLRVVMWVPLDGGGHRRLEFTVDTEGRVTTTSGVRETG